MGSACSCFCAEDIEEHCVSLRLLTHQFIVSCTVFFRRGEVRVVAAAPSSVQRTVPLSSSAQVADNSMSETYRAPPRPLPYDDPRCSQLQLDGLGLMCDKTSSHVHSEPFSRSNNDTETESMSTTDKRNKSNYQGGSKLCYSESSLRHQSAELTSGVTYIFSSSEDEDVCPICLEEYTSENPMITMECSHQFHLGCIYEWMERSEACPLCGKVMLFSETT